MYQMLTRLRLHRIRIEIRTSSKMKAIESWILGLIPFTLLRSVIMQFEMLS
jgi:hypothetical protein